MESFPSQSLSSQFDELTAESAIGNPDRQRRLSPARTSRISELVGPSAPAPATFASAFAISRHSAPLSVRRVLEVTFNHELLSGTCHDLILLAGKECVAAYHECARPLPHQGREGRLDVALTT